MSSLREDDDMCDEPEEKEMIDITSVVAAAANSLTEASPMLCDRDSFNLQDAMAALELMDKKMDCCEIPIAQVAPFGVQIDDDDDRLVFPRPAPTGLDDVIDPLPWDELTNLDAAHIVIQNMVRLEALLGGASVVESTYTCLYAHRPAMEDMKSRLMEPESLTEQIQAIMKPKMKGTIAQNVVYASTLILLELTDTIRSIILNADIYEEEDFTVSTYCIQVFHDRDENTVINTVGDVLEMMVSEVEDTDSDDVQAIALSLKFQLDFLVMCTSMARLNGTVVRNAVQQVQELARSSVKLLEKLLKIVKRIEENITDSIKALIQRTFDTHVNRPLVGNAPVRTVTFRDAEESLALFVTMTKDIDWALCSLMLKGNTFDRIRRMLSTISVSSVNILVRSLIVLNLYFNEQIFGQHPLTELIAKNLQQLSQLPVAVFGNQYVQAFVGRMAKPIYDILKVLVLNRNRQRAYIDAVMLHDWSPVFQEAQLVDAAFRKENPEAPPYFSLYVLSVTIHLMDHFVALGLELDLFCGEHEIAVAYWYRDFLLSSLISQLSRMRQLKLAHRQAEKQTAESKAKSQRGKKKGGKNHNKKQGNGNTKPPSLVSTPEDMEDEFEFLLLNLKRGLCRGIVRVRHVTVANILFSQY
jgi:hypothetical protein